MHVAGTDGNSDGSNNHHHLPRTGALHRTQERSTADWTQERSTADRRASPRTGALRPTHLSGQTYGVDALVSPHFRDGETEA